MNSGDTKEGKKKGGPGLVEYILLVVVVVALTMLFRDKIMKWIGYPPKPWIIAPQGQ